MACFIAPLILSIILILISKFKSDISVRFKLNILILMMLGGSLLLIVEHIWYGEIVPWPPFLTAMRSPEDIGVVIYEVTTIGLPMTFTVSAVWAGLVLVLKYTELRLRVKPTIVTTEVERA
ncbi:MAG: hypothetical protein QW208_00645 [Acidilobaceae archaeon]